MSDAWTRSSVGRADPAQAHSTVVDDRVPGKDRPPTEQARCRSSPRRRATETSTSTTTLNRSRYQARGAAAPPGIGGGGNIAPVVSSTVMIFVLVLWRNPGHRRWPPASMQPVVRAAGGSEQLKPGETVDARRRAGRRRGQHDIIMDSLRATSSGAALIGPPVEPTCAGGSGFGRSSCSPPVIAQDRAGRCRRHRGAGLGFLLERAIS